MPRLAKTTDYTVPVENVGTFTFGRRTMRDEIACQVEYARMIDGVTPTPWLEVVCGAMADLVVLTVRAPADWDIESIDPHDPDAYTKLLAVHRALRDKERSFRPGANTEAGEATGEATV